MSDVFSASPVRSGSGKNLEGFEFIIFTANLFGRRQVLPCSSVEGQRQIRYGQLRTVSRAPGSFVHPVYTSDSLKATLKPKFSKNKVA